MISILERCRLWSSKKRNWREAVAEAVAEVISDGGVYSEMAVLAYSVLNIYSHSRVQSGKYCNVL